MNVRLWVRPLRIRYDACLVEQSSAVIGMPLLAQSHFWSLLFSALLLVGLPIAFWRWARGTEEGPVKLSMKAVLTLFWISSIVFLAAKEAVGLALATALIGGLAVSLVWAPTLGGMLSDGIGGVYTGGSTEIETKPLYSYAKAKLNRGDVTGAIVEVRKQLAQFPEDFEGLMCLARIFVERQNNLSDADEILERISVDPRYSSGEQVAALNQLADWRLKYGLDSNGAREALEGIVRRFPDTEAGYVASQRLAHLTPQEMLDERTHPKPIEVVEHLEKVGLEPRLNPHAEVSPDTAGLRAQQLVDHLASHPQDFEARLELATVYNDHFARPELAIDQLEQLADLPNQPAKNVVHCLHQIADIQVEKMRDPAGAKKTLQRIVELFPQSAAAEKALTRMNYLTLQSKGQRPGGLVKMGSYPQNIGLRSTHRRHEDPG